MRIRKKKKKDYRLGRSLLACSQPSVVGRVSDAVRVLWGEDEVGVHDAQAPLPILESRCLS